ncbi:hypothetical protein BH20BAC1_BH20BAC1_04880 [soil metagenome]
MLKFLQIICILILFTTGIQGRLFAQQDTTHILDSSRVDMRENEDTLIVIANEADTTGKNILALDTAIRKFNPKVATLRSAIIPGWGQAYNKKYWKIPIIYGALGTTAGVFLFNLKTYRLLRQAVIYRRDTIPSNDTLIDPRFQALSTAGIISNRDAFRQNIDYSVLFFLVFWGLNVVDATVDAHLKAFDVSPDITLKIKPSLLRNNNIAGISLVFILKDQKSRRMSSLR